MLRVVIFFGSGLLSAAHQSPVLRCIHTPTLCRFARKSPIIYLLILRFAPRLIVLAQHRDRLIVHACRELPKTLEA